jgi:hypothetical protein
MRYTKLAVVAVAILLLGIVSVAAFAPHSQEAHPRLVSAPEAALETFYVPARHVNSGAAFEKPVQEYY